jgi:hypothetical protein
MDTMLPIDTSALILININHDRDGSKGGLVASREQGLPASQTGPSRNQTCNILALYVCYPLFEAAVEEPSRQRCQTLGTPEQKNKYAFRSRGRGVKNNV